MKKRQRRALAKAVKASPKWLQHVQVNKPPQGRGRVAGTFGPASDVVRIDPATLAPRKD